MTLYTMEYTYHDMSTEIKFVLTMDSLIHNADAIVMTI